ncbi:MAG TPA: hypothetical protein VJN67_25080 [Stellaceae bacterium]|nr:hypothetical protein [Stellaceae bacterium]
MPDANPRLGLVTMAAGDGMITEKDRGGRWLDWLSAHLWWAALLTGGILCVLALVLT